MLEANNSGDAGPSGVRSGKEGVLPAVAVEEADGEDWDLDGRMNAAQACGSGRRGKFGEL